MDDGEGHRRRWRFLTICGSNVPARSRGTSIPASPVLSVSTALGRALFRTFPGFVPTARDPRRQSGEPSTSSKAPGRSGSGAREEADSPQRLFGARPTLTSATPARRSPSSAPNTTEVATARWPSRGPYMPQTFHEMTRTVVSISGPHDWGGISPMKARSAMRRPAGLQHTGPVLRGSPTARTLPRVPPKVPCRARCPSWR